MPEGAVGRGGQWRRVPDAPSDRALGYETEALEVEECDGHVVLAPDSGARVVQGEVVIAEPDAVVDPVVER